MNQFNTMPEAKRFLCWDEKGMSSASNVSVIAHRPISRNVALVCDDEWEGVHNGYGSLLQVDGTYRLYYRAMAAKHLMNKTMTWGPGVICVAESADGITFSKKRIGAFEYNGSYHNNIVFSRTEPIDNFSVFYDENPNCPPDERFKALSDIKRDGKRLLIYYASADGYSFREMYPIEVAGTFDSFNVVLWNAEKGVYELYFRGFHTPEGEDRLNWPHLDAVKDVRDVRLATSSDFRRWEVYGRIAFEEGQEDESLYTNNICRYYRARDRYLGFPVRYRDRAADAHSFEQMPLGDLHQRITELFGRTGTSVTDCLIMTSQDGRTFDRRDDAFLTPGAECRSNWWYGDCYLVYGMCETPAEKDGAARELSLYVGENYRVKNVNFRRMTIRLDGFFSWYAPYRGGEVLTEPVPVTGESLRINFSTSAAGGVAVELCDEGGTPLEGYKSAICFGDSVDREIKFQKSLEELKGQTVTLRFTMSDAHLYSFIFE